MRVEIPPFTTIVWEGREARERYSPVLSWAERSLQHVELLLILAGKRRCDVYHVDPYHMMEQMIYLHRLGLKFRPLRLVRRFSGFAHKHEEPTGLHDALIFGVVGKREEDLLAFERAFRSCDDDAQGALLGYPECCREFFTKVWRAGELDPILAIAKATGMNGKGEVEGDPLLNVLIRYAGARVIPHLPCSFKCEPSRKFALTILSFLKRMDRGMTRRLLELLSKPVVWTQVNGIIEARVEGVFRVIAGGYDSGPQRVVFIPEYDASKLV
ncbi:MAG: hypothetical protein DRJ96_02835 [Thermoprotei archaeon]|nr:MAG: hypothetical protein DRJ96_02835 [Thermoprotei archaeon]